MTEETEQEKLQLDDRVTEIVSGEKGIVAKLGADEGAVFVRWDKDNSQEMVETKNLRKE